MINIGKNKIIHKVIILLLITFCYNSTQGQVYLFPDRSSCVSGDTIWFNTIIINNGPEQSGNVVHVQLDNTSGNHITQISVLCENNLGQGYLPIPDSLSTGTYILKAFSLAKQENNIINQRILIVYNRFENKLESLNAPVLENTKYFNAAPEILIKTNKESFKTREQVEARIQVPAETQNNLKFMFIVAGLEDPFSRKYNSVYIPSQKSELSIPSSLEVEEDNGILVTGKILNQTNPNNGKLVLLSISDSIPYFDYCVSNAEGYFYFYLKNAFGKGELALQALFNDSVFSDNISILGNYINTEPELKTENRMLKNDERIFAANSIDASYYKKLFAGYSSPSLADSFYIAPVYDYPFYGKPSITAFPEFYVDLPDFNEISRELLRGVQFRDKKDEITIRLLDRGINDYFSEEPLKLLDGIPIFDNHILSPLGTKDIKKIDAVYNQRFYGDLAFNGVLAIYTQNKPENWAESVSGVKVFNYKFLQPKTDETVINNNQNEKKNLPDLKHVLFRENDKQIELNHPVNFLTSDISGQISIRVIAVTKQNSILYSEKLIEVK